MSSWAHTDLPGRVRIGAALLLLRTASALTFLYHGSAILFGAFAGPGPEQFARSHHWPLAVGYLVGLAQVAGALAILSGILFRVGAACVFIVMLGAIFLVHLPYGFDVSKGGVEFALTQLLLASAFMLTGPAHTRSPLCFRTGYRNGEAEDNVADGKGITPGSKFFFEPLARILSSIPEAI